MHNQSPQTLLIVLLTLLLAACSTNSQTAPDSNQSPDSADTSVHTPETTESPDTRDTDATDDVNGTDDATEQTPDPCPPFTKRTRTGRLMSTEIDEASGLAASWNHPDLLWTHNDSGDTARLFLIRPGGSTVAEILLTSVSKAIDWEDMAIAPCDANSETACIYVADVGDNLKKREKVVIYRFPEPVISPDVLDQHTPDAPAIELNIEKADEIWLTYPEGPRDVETLMVHPKTAAIYLVEKNETSDAPVFRVPTPAFGTSTTPETPASAAPIATLHHKGLSGLTAMLTAGDISPDGREFTVRTYLQAFTYCMPAETNDADAFETAFAAPPVRSSLPILGQAETLTYDRTSNAIWITSEGEFSPIYSVTRVDAANAE